MYSLHCDTWRLDNDVAGVMIAKHVMIATRALSQSRLTALLTDLVGDLDSRAQI